MLAVAAGTANAFLLERASFRGKAALSLAMLAPLVIPGVILGISILAFASRLARLADDYLGLELEFLRPGLPLVVAGQFSFIVSIATLTIAARLKRFDMALEEAALNLGATRAAVLWTVTLPYLKPALIGAAAIAFLMSFENFNTTLMLVGSDPPLTIMMYGRMREGASPVLNAVSLFLMVASALLALVLLRRPGGGRAAPDRGRRSPPRFPLMKTFPDDRLGLGAMGSAALHHLAKRGHRVLGIDRHSPPHASGSSHGETRITRLAIGEGEHYTPLAMRSHELWRELERETGTTLLMSHRRVVHFERCDRQCCTSRASSPTRSRRR